VVLNPSLPRTPPLRIVKSSCPPTSPVFFHPPPIPLLVQSTLQVYFFGRPSRSVFPFLLPVPECSFPNFGYTGSRSGLVSLTHSTMAFFFGLGFHNLLAARRHFRHNIPLSYCCFMNRTARLSPPQPLIPSPTRFLPPECCTFRPCLTEPL